MTPQLDAKLEAEPSLNGTASEPQPPFESMITEITVIRLAVLEAKLEALNRRARRLGCGEASMRIISKQAQKRGVYIVDLDDPRKERRWVRDEMVETTTVEVTCPDEPVALNGWRFVARLTPVDGGGNVVAGNAGLECPHDYFTAAVQCDHCHTNRRRKDSFVVRHEDGTFRQIGRNCLCDFLGNRGADSLAKYFEFVSERTEILSDWEQSDSEFWEGGGSVERVYSLDNAIATGLAVSPRGYVSKSRAMETDTTPTADLAAAAIADRYCPTDEQMAEAEEIIADTIASVPAGTQDSYQHNIRAIALAGYCTPSTLGIACSMIAAHRRRIADRDRAERGARSQHVGAIGERIVVEGEIVGTYESESYAGPRRIFTTRCFIRDGADNMLVANNLGKRGDRVRFKATVKSHGEYREVKQTVLSRPSSLA